MELLRAMREMSVTATCGISVLEVWGCVKAGQDRGGHKVPDSLAQGEPSALHSALGSGHCVPAVDCHPLCLPGSSHAVGDWISAWDTQRPWETHGDHCLESKRPEPWLGRNVSSFLCFPPPYFAGGPSLFFIFFDLLISLERELEPGILTVVLMMWEAWLGDVCLKQAI